MCERGDLVAHQLSRRHFLAAGPVAAAVVALPATRRRQLRTVPVTADLDIVPRVEWAPDLAATGPIPDEPDVRFLIVHHSVNANTYGEEAVVDLLRGIHRFHTGERGWPDIAYNFFVDRFGRVWEGRTGSIDGLKAGDATGGNQGFSQLCCFLGDHSHEPPSADAQASMGRLLGWLAGRAGLDVTPGATTTFVSRGSNRHPAGTEVATATIAGHRDMSLTACPGDAGQALVLDGTFARLAAPAARQPAGPATTSTSPTTTTTTTTQPRAPSLTPQPPRDAAPPPGGDGPSGLPAWVLGSGAALAAAVAAGTAGVVRRRQSVGAAAGRSGDRRP